MVAEINTGEVYKIIKKQNGEEFAKILRRNVLLDIPNLKHVLEFAGRNPEDAIALVPLLREIKEKSGELSPKQTQEEIRDPIDLLNEAGYNAFYVKNLLQQNSIAKYFKHDERLCTFSDLTRYKDYYMIHAVKKNVKDIKRSENPEREDEYGTSVISIQIAKDGGFISIKNRYNHTVNNPDATFNNNPDNIIPGLTESLKRKFNVDFVTQQATLPHNYRIINDQLVHFNYERDNIYYGDKYYFSGSTITKLNPDYELMLDYIILDTRNNTLRNVLDFSYAGANDFKNILNNEIAGHKIKIEKDKKTGEVIINIVDENKNYKELLRTENGCITSLHLYRTESIDGGVMRHNQSLKELYAPKLKKIGAHSLENTKNLTKLYVPELEEIERSVFLHAENLEEFNAPKLKKIHSGCFGYARNLKHIFIPDLIEMSLSCFSQNDELEEFNAPKLKKIGNGCFVFSPKLKKIYVPELEEMGNDCFANAKFLKNIILPKLNKMGESCFKYNRFLKTLYAPKLEEMGIFCFNYIEIIKDLYVPKLKITTDTSKGILRSVKLLKMKDAIKNMFRLFHRNADEKNIIGTPSSQRDM